MGFCDQYTYSSISGIRVRINVGVHIMDYLITIHGPYFDYVYIRDYGVCYFDYVYIILIRICLGRRLGNGNSIWGFRFIISINGRGVTHYNRQCIRLLRDFIEEPYIMAHINTTLINKPTLGQITHCPSIYYRFKSF